MLRFVAALWVLGTWTACGGSVPGPTVTSPFTGRDAQLFDDGLDLMEDPDALHGQWRADWERELTERIGRSDAIVEGEVATIHVDSDLDKRKSYRIVLKVRKVYRGDLGPGVTEISLITREGALGYGGIASNPDRALRRPFVAFMKYVQAPARPRAHFHLTPPSIALRRALVVVSQGKD